MRFTNILLKIINPWVLVICLGSVSIDYHQNRSIFNVKKDIIKIDIKWVDFSIETFFAVDCDGFESNFDDFDKFNITLTANNKIDSIANMIKGMKRIDNAYQPDVRGKMWLYHSNKTIDIICFNNGVLRYKGNSYYSPPQLIKFMWDNRKQQSSKQKQ